MNWASRKKPGTGLRLLLLLPVLALGCAACADGVQGRASAVPVPKLSAGQVVRQALADLAEAGVLHFHGTLVNPNHKQLGLDASVTATGEAGGTLTVAGQRGSLVVVNGALYVDAPARFWSLLADEQDGEAKAVDSRWVKVPTVTIGVDIGAMLRPNAFGGLLAGQVDPSAGGSLGDAPTATVHGTKAFAVPVGQDTVDLAAAGARGVVHVDLPTGFGSASNVSLDVADVSLSEAGVYQSLAAQATALSTAVDTQIDIEQGGQRWGACTATGCSVLVTFTNKSSVATKVVVTGEWLGDHQPAGTCHVLTAAVPAGRSATAACTNNSPQWRSFFTAAHTTPGDHPYEVDWTAEALAAPPNLDTLQDEATAAAAPGPTEPNRADAHAYVYVIHYQDDQKHQKVWKYGVTDNPTWRQVAAAQLTPCRAATHTSCEANLVTPTANRPSADALVANLVAEAGGRDGCPPGQWVDCATPAG